MASGDNDNLYNYYEPNKIVAIVFAAFFLFSSAVHTWKIVSTRQWFGIAIVIGGICMSPSQSHYQKCEGIDINKIFLLQSRLWVLQHERLDMIT